MSDDDKPRGEPAVKAKLPNAKNIRSPEFTPHGISGGRTGGQPLRTSAKASGLTAAQARKRRNIAIAVAVVAVLAIAGGTTWYVTRPAPKVEVTGAFGSAPKVKIPGSVTPPKGLKVTEPITGSGAKIGANTLALLHYEIYEWAPKGKEKKGSTSKKVLDTREKTELNPQPGPQLLPVDKLQVKGLKNGLTGKTEGSRVVLQIPPDQSFDPQSAQQFGLSEGDSVLFVADILKVVPSGAEASGTEQKLDDKNLPTVEPQKGKAPKVTIPKVDPPKTMQVKTLIQGNGPTTTKDDTAVVNYVGDIWGTGKQFDSSWEKGAPAAFPLADPPPGAMPGFFKGLRGLKVGSRVMLILPPNDGYGKQGNPQAGIKGTDTVVFVVDILGAAKTT
ncbi:FKBP-type peptidyl-prolyl cis-trans isomerase [Actinomadura gamaensis]|uniref:peptidylprolyl isomerase n=1 Tax=Actinomadura gamaensis TaxID=1763541 RepID=A0ABV9U4P6_9ACTN